MRSLLASIITALDAATFSITGVSVRSPYDESTKQYPMVVVHEIVNLPDSFATVSDEQRTSLSYQIDIYTKNCLIGTAPTTAYDAGRVLTSEVNALLSNNFAFTRRSITDNRPTTDVVVNILRGDCLLDSYGYSYRP